MLLLTGQFLAMMLFLGPMVGGYASDQIFCWSTFCREDAATVVQVVREMPPLDPAFRPYCEVVADRECGR